jgi:cobalt/nickel transport system permease protein
MKPNFLDHHSRLDSRIHRLPAAVKLLGALGVVLAIVLAPRTAWLFLAGIAVGLILVAGMSRVPAGFLARRLLLLELVVLGMALLSVLQPLVFAAVITKSTLCLLTMILLANTTPFAAILRVLRQLRVPDIFITTLALMYRYLFVLADEAERMQRARQSRTFTRQRWLTWKTLATVIGQLFVRSTERAERIYAAMCARGWR